MEAGDQHPRVRRAGRTRLVAAALLALLGLGATIQKDVLPVKGSSMAPLLRPGQLLVVNRAAYDTPDRAGPQRGDIVVFRRVPAADDDYIVKRVIGLPGDLVHIEAGRVFVNGTQLQEPYVAASDDYTYPLQGGPVRVPDGAYFVLGDNRPESADSHLGWFVPAGDVVGQAWPLPMFVPVR